MTEEEQSYSVDPGLNLELEKGSDLELVPPTFQLQDQYGQTTIDLNLNADNVSLNGSVNEHNNSLNELQHIVSVEGGKQLNNGDIAIQLPLMFPSDTASNHSSNEMVLNIPSNPDASTDENRLSQSLYSETGSYTESSDRARNYSHGSEDSASIISEAEKRGTFTKKIPLSEFATLQGILAHQVDEGAPCLKCEPGKCSGLELHFWKKVCKSCGCPRGCHKIQRLVEDKKEAPKSILLQTADEDEEDYKEIEILAPPKGFLLQSKTERQNAATEAAYKEEYINRLKEFYSGRKALHISEEEKLTPEQIFILQNYINQTQGTEVISPEVLQNSIHSLAKHSGPTYQYGSDDNIAIKRTQSVSSILSSDSEVNLNQGTPPPKLLQVIQHLTLNPDQGSLGNRSPSPSQHPIIKDQYTNPATLNMSGGRGSPGRGTPNKEPVVRRDDDYSDSRSEDSLTDSRSHSDYTSSEGSRTRSEYTTEDSYTKELSTVNEEDEYTRSSNNKARGRGSPRILKQQDITEENSTIDMIDRITDVSRLHNTETVIAIKRTRAQPDSANSSLSRDGRRPDNRRGDMSPNERNRMSTNERNRMSPNEKFSPKERNRRPDDNERSMDRKYLDIDGRSDDSGRSFDADDRSREKIDGRSRNNSDRERDSPKRNQGKGKDETRLPHPTNDRRHKNRIIRNRSYSDKDRSSDSDSRGDVIIKAPPPKPIRRNPGSFDDLTQGDIIDYYTNVNPSGEPAATQSMKRKGSPGVWVPPGLDAALVVE